MIEYVPDNYDIYKHHESEEERYERIKRRYETEENVEVDEMKYYGEDE